MLSDLATSALAELRAKGLKPSDADIVHLHALALKVQFAEDSTEVYAAPRVAWLGGVAIHEPTLAARLWLADHADRMASDDNTLLLLKLWACAHAQEPGFFARKHMFSSLLVREEVAIWLRVSGVDCHTVHQVRNVLAYVYDGSALDALEFPPPVASQLERLFDQTTSDLLHARLHDAIALLGAGGDVTVSALTLRAADHVLLRASLIRGATLKGASADALGDFYAAAEEIERRLESEVQHGN